MIGTIFDRASIIERWRAVARPPAGWVPFSQSEVPSLGYDRIPMFGHRVSGLAVGMTIDATPSGEFAHVSVSHRSRLPYWHDVRFVKDTWLGPEREAVHAVPPRERHVNVHDYTIHLWSRVDGAPILDPVLGLFV